MAAPFVTWSIRRWTPRRKHQAPGQNVAWSQVVLETGIRHGVARYLRGVNVQELEMSCIDYALLTPEERRRFPSADQRGMCEELPAVRTKRSFFCQMNFLVGASSGEETSFVYVEWHQAGDIHGRPITFDELIVKGLQ